MRITPEEQQHALALLEELIRIPSPYFEEENIMLFTKMIAQNYNLPSQLHTYFYEPFHFRGLNLYGQIGSGEGPLLYVGGHLDTVKPASGWVHPPLSPTREGDRLYGTGALDMKAGCAAILYALKRFHEDMPHFRGRILYHFASVEEGPYGLGTTFFIHDILKEKPDFALITEPASLLSETTTPTLCLAAKGGYNYKVHLKGKSAHAATPHRGISAAEDAAKLLLKLNHIQTPTDPLMGTGASCVIGISSWAGAASVPDEATLEVFRHVVPGETKASLEKEIISAIEKADIASQWIISFRESPLEGFDGGFPPYKTDAQHPILALLASAIEERLGKAPLLSYSQSIGDFNLIGGVLGVPTAIFGPSGGNLHSAEEYVTLSSYYELIDILYRFFEKLFC